jgi:hypothetical protein
MKRAFVLMVLPALLVALAVAQTPGASSNPDQTIKGCLGGSDGNYTLAEDNTGHIFKITTSTVDFKQHLGHEVTLIGHRTSTASSAAADSSFTITELNIISDHCAVVAAAPTATVTTPAETAVTLAAAAEVPVVTTSSTVPETAISLDGTAALPVPAVSTPEKTAVTPNAADAPPAETAITPAADAAAATAAVETPWDKPAAESADRTLPVHSRRRPATSAAVATPPAVTASTSSETASTPAATSPVPPASTPSDTAGAQDASAATPIVPAKRGALWLLITLAVLVIAIGTLVPFLSRWRKRKMLERPGAPNLSLTREASSDQAKSDPQEPRKAA